MAGQVFHGLSHLGQIRTIAHHHQMNIPVYGHQLAKYIRQHMQVLFSGDPPHIDQGQTGPDTEPFAQNAVAVLRMELPGVDAPGIDLDLLGFDPFFDQFVTGTLGGGVDHVQLIIIPEHIFPGQIGDHRVSGEDLRILWDGCMISAADGQFEDFGDGQSGQSDGAGRGGVNMGKILFVAELEHLQQGRIEDFLFRILGQFIGSDGFEVDHAGLILIVIILMAGHHRIADVVLHRQFGMLSQRQGDAVDFIIGVRKMGDAELVVRRRIVRFFNRSISLVNTIAECAVFGELGIGHKIGSQQGIESSGGADGVKDIENVGAGKVIQQMVAEMQHDTLRGPVDEFEPLSFLGDKIGVGVDGFEKIRVVLDHATGFMAQQGD